MERRQGISVLRLHDVLLERRDNVLRGRNNDAPISTSPQRLKQVSNEFPNYVSVVQLQDVSVVRIHDFPLLRLYDVSCKSQTKHPITLLWYVCTTCWSYVVATVSTFSGYFVMNSIW